MEDKTLVVSVKARIEWLNPPKNKEEEVMRERANMIALQSGKQLELAVQLLVSELLRARMEGMQ